MILSYLKTYHKRKFTLQCILTSKYSICPCPLPTLTFYCIWLPSSIFSSYLALRIRRIVNNLACLKVFYFTLLLLKMMFKTITKFTGFSSIFSSAISFQDFHLSGQVKSVFGPQQQ